MKEDKEGERAGERKERKEWDDEEDSLKGKKTIRRKGREKIRKKGKREVRRVGETIRKEKSGQE